MSADRHAASRGTLHLRPVREEHIQKSANRSEIVNTDYAAEMAKVMRTTVLREAARFVTQLALTQNATLVKSLIP